MGERGGIEAKTKRELAFISRAGTFVSVTAIYRLSDVDGQWTIQSHLLQIPRDAFAAMVVPETLLPCS